MTDHIQKMLTDAYRHLGITDTKENDREVFTKSPMRLWSWRMSTSL